MVWITSDVEVSKDAGSEKLSYVKGNESDLFYSISFLTGIPDEVDIAIDKTHVVIQHAVLETHNTARLRVFSFARIDFLYYVADHWRALHRK